MIGLFFLSVPSVYADGFVVNLFYNTTSHTLTFDKFVGENVSRDENADTSIIEFVKDETVGSYILKLYDINGVEFVSHEFNKKDGAFQLVIPYFSIANRLTIIDKSTSELLLVDDLSRYVSCNGNGKCESTLGETNLNCMGDCNASTTAQSMQVKNIDEQTNVKESAEVAESEKSIGQKIVQFFRNLF